MDIDYFKNFNDINGHQAGDLLLKEISQIMKSCIRGSDVVARYGEKNLQPYSQILQKIMQ